MPRQCVFGGERRNIVLNPSPLSRALAAACLVLPAGLAHAQGVLKPVDARIVNTTSNPVPVVGTVTLGGGGVTGTLKSGDKTVTVHDAAIEVTSTSSGSQLTPALDVGDYKEVRVAISNGSCSPCSNLVVEVYARTANGGSYQIDEFPVNFTATSLGAWNSKTYTTPGSKLVIAVRATTPGSSNSVRVALFGRAN
jgi:hypothetical protein